MEAKGADGMEVEGRAASSSAGGMSSSSLGSMSMGMGILGGTAFGAPPMPFGFSSFMGRATSSAGTGHDGLGGCRHGACGCPCDCVCACECIVRQTSVCFCVPLEERDGACGPPELSAWGAFFSSDGAICPPSRQPSKGNVFGEADDEPSYAAPPEPPEPDPLQAALAGAGFGGLPTGVGGSEVTSRKRGRADDTPGLSLRTAAQPAVKKFIGQTVDLRGNYRPTAIDAEEVLNPD